MAFPWNDSLSTIGGLAGAVAALAAWQAARKANATADAVARIERERWHSELTPQFSITIRRVEGNRATLDVQLVGPLPLVRLDEVAISITSSDDAERIDRLPGGPTQQEIDAQVWAMYRFTHGADGADVNGHTVSPVSLRVGRGRPFGIQETIPPHWQEGQDVNLHWSMQWSDRPLRLVLHCRKGELDPWTVPYDVETPLPEGIRPPDH